MTYFKFLRECKKIYEAELGKNTIRREQFFQDIRKLFSLYTQQRIAEDKAHQIEELQTQNMSAPIIRDIAESVLKTGIGISITLRDGTKTDFKAPNSFEDAQKNAMELHGLLGIDK